jgi:hypothetical protein
MARLKRRKSPTNCLLFFGFSLFLILTFYLTWNKRKHSFEDVKPGEVTTKLRIEDQPVFDDFEDDFADLPLRKKKLTKKNINSRHDFSNLDPPKVAQDILELHKLLNLTNPGDNFRFSLQENC